MLKGIQNKLKHSYTSIVMLCLFSSVTAFGSAFPVGEKTDDTTHSKSRKEHRKQEKLQLKHSHQRMMIQGSAVYAKLRTTAAFELPGGVLSAKVSLENNFGLPDTRVFFSGSLLYRFTPRSGLFVEYYGLNRNENYTTQKELIFMKDTIPVGTSGEAFFNTQVLSAGYLLSILKDPNAFLGAYFNVYIMFIETGFNSTHGELNPNLSFTAPLPSFGLVAMFKINNWFLINGQVGFFNINLPTFGGKMYSFEIAAVFKPAKWLGLSISYQEFDVTVYFPSDKVNSTIDYNFRGPAFGISLIF